MEEAIIEKGNGGNRIYYCKNIIKLERPFSRPVVWLHQRENNLLIYRDIWLNKIFNLSLKKIVGDMETNLVHVP